MHRAAGMGLAVEQSPWEALVLDTAGSLENRLLVYCPNGACSLGIECRSKDKLSLGPEGSRAMVSLGGLHQGSQYRGRHGPEGPRQSWQSPQGLRIDPAPPDTGGDLSHVG